MILCTATACTAQPTMSCHAITSKQFMAMQLSNRPLCVLQLHAQLAELTISRHVGTVMIPLQQFMSMQPENMPLCCGLAITKDIVSPFGESLQMGIVHTNEYMCMCACLHVCIMYKFNFQTLLHNNHILV